MSERLLKLNSNMDKEEHAIYARTRRNTTTFAVTSQLTVRDFCIRLMKYGWLLVSGSLQDTVLKIDFTNNRTINTDGEAVKKFNV
jgi:hypothetical protein